MSVLAVTAIVSCNICISTYVPCGGGFTNYFNIGSLDEVSMFASFFFSFFFSCTYFNHDNLN